MSGAETVLAEIAARRGLPGSVSLQLTSRCNYRCAHCYQGDSPRSGATELSLGEIERILGQLADAGILLLLLTGGEIFTRRDALDIVAMAHQHRFALRLKTNAHYLDSRRVEALAAARPLQVEISLYGATPEVHEAITGVTGSWQRVVSAVRRLIENGIEVTLSSPILEGNAFHAGRMRDLAHSLRANWTSDPHIAPMTNGDLGPAALRMRWTTLRDFYAGRFGGGVREELIERHTANEPDALNTLQDWPCGAATQTVSISATGQLTACNMLPAPAGDLRVHEFRDVWRDSKVLRDLRNLRFAAIPDCKVCALRPYCRRCHAIALSEQGSLLGASLEACRHAVAVRDMLREQQVIPASETALPPTWQRVDLEGQHSRDQEKRRCGCG